MAQDPQSTSKDSPKRHTRLWFALGIVLILLVLLIVPPMISINRYRTRITELISASLGRPVHLSSVELRMLPRPGFLITNFTVDADPDFGAEPVLHAESVFAAVRLLPLWRGSLEISRITVDEASVNLIRNAAGHWNLDSLFRTAAAHPGPASSRPIPLPYMEATNSRINVKNGTEKLPFSILEADASLWSEDDGSWRVRLRGQPARTDLSLDLADTGLVRLEAMLRPAPSLNQMPLRIDVDWREAQLGQLSRLVLGSDEGWRGDLTGEMHVDGTADAATIKTRLRASGVHRVEFAPAAPLDFDASCGFVYHFTARSLQNLRCDSPLGDGHARVTGEIAGNGQPPHFTLELDRIPAQAGMDVLRTLRSDLDASLEAAGSLSGKLTYDGADSATPPAPPAAKNRRRGQAPAPAPQPLSGALIVDNLRLSGGGLSKPISIAKLTLNPLPAVPGQLPALATSFSLPAGAPAPLQLTAQFAARGFQVGVHGTATLARLAELAHVAGIGNASVLHAVTGDPADLDLQIHGSWLPSVVTAFGSGAGPSSPEQMSGTLTLQNASWKADYLSNPVQINSATLHLEDGGLRWDPVDFAYGPVAGSAALELPAQCPNSQECLPKLELRFGTLDAATLQSALLGAHESGTLLSTLLSRLQSNAGPVWPNLEGTVQADVLALGPFTFSGVSGAFHLLPAGAEFTAIDGSVLGGSVHAQASMSVDGKPDYKVTSTFAQLNPQQVGDLVGMQWSSGTLAGSLQLELAGYADTDLAASAKGTLHFDWNRGSIAAPPPAPALLSHFDRWTGDALIANGSLKVQQNQVQRSTRQAQVDASVTFGSPPKVTLSAAPETQASRR